MSLLNGNVLVLNQSFEPMSVTSVRKAIILVYLGKAEMVEKNCEFVHSVNEEFPLPSIVRIKRYIHVPRKRIILTRKNIMRRDNHRCQYCGRKDVGLTIDHVIPKVRGGPDTWENLVCACVHCNNKKGNRTPEEAGMTLLHEPKRPNHIFFIRYTAGRIDKRWKPYLFMN
ncbi:MAG: HNH endonuclease [Calditrichaeota bacterium]|nr:HNH endonuclease [Calditrichota bacterium]